MPADSVRSSACGSRSRASTSRSSRAAHVDAIRAGGLRLEGFRGDLVVTKNLPRAVATPDEATGHFDYLVLLVKAKDTQATLAVGGRTA